MSFYAFYPPSGSANASVGANGATIPGSSTLVAGENPSGDLQPLQTDASGSLLVTPDPTSVQHVIVDSSALPTGAATSANQSTILTRLSGSLVPTAFDEINLTYVPSGDGAGQVQTAVYKLATVTVATLTMSYNSDNNLTSVVKS